MAKNSNSLLELKQLGQSIWLDSIRRGQIQSGELKKLIDEDGISGETANPTIFEKAIAGSSDYDDAIRKLVDAGKDALEIYETLAIEDVRMAADVFRPVYNQTNGADGFVSLEVSPKLAHDTSGTIAEVKRFFSAVNRPNVMIKIPGTREGVPAIEECLYQGININITLLFSIASYEAVAWAYIRALERRVAEGKPIDRMASVASFFVSRIDTLADNLLADKMRATSDPALGAKLEALGGKVAIANVKLAYQLFKKIFSDPRFLALKEQGARVQRPLWASTSTKNPHYSDVLYVETLIGPDTINTLPMETILAFKDHGKARLTIEEDLDGARKALRELEEVGLSLDAITQQVLEEGVVKFDESLDKLLQSIEEKHGAMAKGIAARHRASLGQYADAVKSALAAADKNKICERLWKKDASLWKSEPAQQALIKNTLGWLTIASQMRDQVDTLRAFGAEIKNAGFKNVVLCGMGGSSQGVQVCRATFGSAPGFPTLFVLDTTDPATIRALERKVDANKTLFIISSKSGGTIETLEQFKYFYGRVKAGKNFVAITDADSPLDKIAQEKNFLRTFHNPADIGGRYSALSYFGLVPVAVMGIDIERILDSAEEMVHACASSVPAEKNPGVWLGVVLATLAKQGRDKVTLVASPGIDSFGMWAEQLIAESTGKEGKGLVPVDSEPLGAPSVYGDDRVFVYLRLENAKNAALDKRMNAIESAGQPVIRLHLDDAYDIGAEFFRWEFAIAVAGALVGIDAFDQPNVQESKGNTQRVLAGQTTDNRRQMTNKPVFENKQFAVYGTASTRNYGSLRDALGAFLNQARAGDYLALMAYLEQAPANHRALQSIRVAARAAKKIATTLGYGPRFLHSTGQLHKGGPNTVLGLQITADDSVDAKIPGESYSFGELRRAQAIGDWQALMNHGRRALRVHLKRGARMEQLAKEFQGALGERLRKKLTETRRARR